jgi:predicted TIM-barrel fold metal-dependent hydrolase
MAGQPTIMHDIGLSNDRVAQPKSGFSLPTGSLVVSADNHWSITEDVFFEGAPAALKPRMPRLIWDDKGFDFLVNGRSIFSSAQKEIFRTFEGLPGCTQLAPRLLDLDIEGIQKEIVFGNGVGIFFAYPDLEVRQCAIDIYNQYIANMSEKAAGRFYGVGFVNFWDPSRTRESIESVKALGLKTVSIPINPRGADGMALDYCTPEMEPMWAALEEAGLPLCFHVGEFFQDGPGSIGRTSMVSLGPFRKSLGDMIFGGILDRHPGLRVVFVEGDINWIPGALQLAEVLYQGYRDILQPKLKHEPAHYWFNNCYATFMYDPVGLGMLDAIGADRVMWSSDYPHVESTFGYNWAAMQMVVDIAGAREARMILGETANDLFNLGDAPAVGLAR